jgi:hypothetical protein
VPASFTRDVAAQGGDPQPLIEKAIAAKGGLPLLRSIATVKSTSEMVFATPNGKIRVNATAYVRYPGQFRVDAEGPDGLRIQTFDNGAAWVGDGRAFEEAPAVIVRAMQAGVQRDTVSLLLALADKRVTGRRVADVNVDGEVMPALEVDLAPAGRLTLAFDAKSGLLVHQRYGGDGEEPVTEETFSDYRPIQGLQVAHRATVRRESSPPFDRIVRTFEINVPLEPSFFKKPVR